MPNRYLRASYVDSKRINALSAEAERMFCRLLVHVDDFGRCEACSDLLLGKLFARQLSRVNMAMVRSWVEELARNELLFIYVANGCEYIQLNTWERGRAKHSRCPNPPTDVSKRLQMYADENISPDSDSDSDTDTDTDTDQDFDAFWKSYPKRVGKAAALKAWKRAKKPSIEAIIAKLNTLKASDQWRKDGGQYIPFPATWIRRGGWDDEVGVKVESKTSQYKDFDQQMREQGLTT